MSFLEDFPDAKLYYLIVKEQVQDRALWDDCVQEAIIAVWMARQKHPGKPQTYYNAVARKRIQRVSQSQLFLDTPPSLCGKWMPRSGSLCSRRENHPGSCTSKAGLGKSTDTARRTNASHDVLRRSPASYDQLFHGWCDEYNR